MTTHRSLAALVAPLTVDDVLTNLESVRVGAVCCSDDAIRPLLRARLVRTNPKGWLDLTPAGRALLADRGTALAAAGADAAAPQGPQLPDPEQRARALGADAFQRGIGCAPALDAAFRTLLTPGAPIGASLPLLRAWHRGWTEANIAAPISGDS